MTYEYKNKITNRDLQKQPLRSRTWNWYMVVAQLTWQLPDTLKQRGTIITLSKEKKHLFDAVFRDRLSLQV